MKKTTIICSLFFCNFTFSQSGFTRTEAIPIQPQSNCNFQTFSASGNEAWHKFVATTEDVSITLKTQAFGNNNPHIHNISIFEGANQSEKTHDELPFNNPADRLDIDLNASKLIIGETYYLKLDREAHIGSCDKGNCHNNNGQNPASYQLCIEAMNVIIPLDYSLEKPLVSYALETNKGQLLNSDNIPADEVQFYNDAVNPAIYLSNRGVSLSFSQVDAQTEETFMQRIDMEFVNGNSDIRLFRSEELDEIKNYYLPHNEKGFLDVKSYSRVVMNEVYHNIDLQYYSNQNGMKYYFNVKPQGNPDDIILNFRGAEGVTLNSDGSLNVISHFGSITFDKPIAYQVNPGDQIVPMPNQGGFELLGNNQVKFDVMNYPHDMPLFIVFSEKGNSVYQDKTDNLMWSTYYGRGNRDEIADLTTDEEGFMYYVGSTVGGNFPAQTQSIIGGASDHHIICGSFETEGVRRWSTIYGAQLDMGQAIATDKLGNVYITGVSASSSNGVNQFLDFYDGSSYNLAPSASPVFNSYAFVIKFNKDAGNRTWATLFGEHNNGAFYNGNAIACDGLGRVYIGGSGKRIIDAPIVGTGSATMNSENDVQKGFIAMFTADDNALEWSTLFGNTELSISDFAIDKYNFLYVTGTAIATNQEQLLPSSPDNPLDYSVTNNGGTDAFVAKFNFQHHLSWSTFLGGSLDDQGHGISVSGNGDVAVVGRTRSYNDIPLHVIGGSSYYSDVNAGGDDGFITVFDTQTNGVNGYSIKYSSFYGGENVDYFNKVQYSDFGNLYAVGTTASADMPVKSLFGAYNQNLLENTQNGTHTNAVIFALNSDYDHIWTSYFGGSPNQTYYNYTSNDLGNSIAVYKDEYFFIGGETNSQTNFPVVHGPDPQAYYQDHNGSYIFAETNQDNYADGFLAQFELTGLPLSIENELSINTDFSNYLIYPNPSNGFFTIFDKTNKSLYEIEKLEIVDVSGKIVKDFWYKENHKANSLSFDVSDLPSGFYHLQLVKKDQASPEIFKLIKN